MELIDKYLGEGKKDYVTNVWGNLQLIKNIKDELKQAKKSKKDVWHSQTNKTMKYTDFVKKTEKILKGVNEAKKEEIPKEVYIMVGMLYDVIDDIINNEDILSYKKEKETIQKLFGKSFDNVKKIWKNSKGKEENFHNALIKLGFDFSPKTRKIIDKLYY